MAQTIWPRVSRPRPKPAKASARVGGRGLYGALSKLPRRVSHHAARVECLAARALLVVRQGHLLVSLREVGNEKDRLRQSVNRFIQLSALQVGGTHQVPGVGVAPLNAGGLLQVLDGLIRLLLVQSYASEIVVGAL